jgi:hypothetical protein
MRVHVLVREQVNRLQPGATGQTKVSWPLAFEGDDLRRQIPIRTIMTAAALAVTSALPSVAQAGLLVASAPPCDTGQIERPFARWLDPISYSLVPDGGLEAGGEGWHLTGGAKVVDGNETFYVHGTGEQRALALPRGSSATTPATCARIDKPVMHFFSKASGGLLATATSTLSVEVLFETASGSVASLPVGIALPSSKWQPTLPLPVLASLLPLLPSEQTPIAFRFRPVGSASWTIDDVYLDPWRR